MKNLIVVYKEVLISSDGNKMNERDLSMPFYNLEDVGNKFKIMWKPEQLINAEAMHKSFTKMNKIKNFCSKFIKNGEQEFSQQSVIQLDIKSEKIRYKNQIIFLKGIIKVKMK